jgi:small subunit ribosomal protein S17
MRLPSKRKQRTGVVISGNMNKSIVVRIDRTAKHPIYKRIIKKSAKIMAHDENKKAKAGDKVRVEESKPRSKNKRWRLVEIVK